jgi:hypothetical protein
MSGSSGIDYRIAAWWIERQRENLDLECVWDVVQGEKPANGVAIRGGAIEEHPAGPEGRVDFDRLLARLKPGPDTKHFRKRVFPRPVKLCSKKKLRFIPRGSAAPVDDCYEALPKNEFFRSV